MKIIANFPTKSLSGLSTLTVFKSVEGVSRRRPLSYADDIGVKNCEPRSDDGFNLEKVFRNSVSLTRFLINLGNE